MLYNNLPALSAPLSLRPSTPRFCNCKDPSRHRPRRNSKMQTHRHSSIRQPSSRGKLAGQTLASGVQFVAVPKAAYNQARRILVPESATLPLVTVSMRADLQFFDRTNR